MSKWSPQMLINRSLGLALGAEMRVAWALEVEMQVGSVLGMEGRENFSTLWARKTYKRMKIDA